MLRQHIKDGTSLGKQAKAAMDGGKLVADSVMVGMVLERLKQPDVATRGCLLDGFPRTEAQAQALADAGVVPSYVIALEVADAELVKRVVGRRLDPETGAIYHVEYNPPPEGDAALLKRLVQRSDDTEATAKQRIATYNKNYSALVSHFAARQVEIRVIDGNRKPSDVSADVLKIFPAGLRSENDRSDKLLGSQEGRAPPLKEQTIKSAR